MQVAAADAGRGDADQGVGGLLDDRVGDVLDADVAGAVHECCAHDDFPCWWFVPGGQRGRVAKTSLTTGSAENTVGHPE